MNKAAALVAVSALGLGLAFDASAQTRTPAPADRQAPPREVFRDAHGLQESSDIIGARVKNAQGKDIGEIDQLLIDPASGKIAHAVVGVGGLLGVGERRVVVPWSAVRMVPDQAGRVDRPVISMDEAALERAPRYEKRALIDGDRSAPSASPRNPASRPATDRPAGSTDRPAASPPPSNPSGTTR